MRFLVVKSDVEIVKKIRFRLFFFQVVLFLRFEVRFGRYFFQLVFVVRSLFLVRVVFRFVDNVYFSVYFIYMTGDSRVVCYRVLCLEILMEKYRFNKLFFIFLECGSMLVFLGFRGVSGFRGIYFFVGQGRRDFRRIRGLL